jgi:pyridinium-3,5-biscarboxylic acid mononucleotide synthase
LLPDGRIAHELQDREFGLDPDTLPEISHPQVTRGPACVDEKLADGGLGSVNPAQASRRDGDAIGDAARQARRGRLVPRRQAPPAAQRTDVVLRHAHLVQRAANSPLPGRPDPWPEPTAHVVGVRPGHDQAEIPLAGQRQQIVEQRRLAEVAAVGTVGPVSVHIHLPSRQHAVTYAESLGDSSRPRELSRGQRVRHRGRPGHQARPYGARGTGQHKRGVGAARIGDKYPLTIRKPRHQGVCQTCHMAETGDSGRVGHEFIFPDGRDQQQPVSRADTAVDLGFARLDVGRIIRTGDPEVVFGSGKTSGQLVTILRHLAAATPGRAILATRCGLAGLQACREAFPDGLADELSDTFTLGPRPDPAGMVAVVAAGTADLPVAAEAVATVSVFGSATDLIADVGVAGIHRLLAVRERIADADVAIAVAGMEGALPSVLGGLVGLPLIGVPTSTGYGLSLGGVTALLAMLNSCAPGVTVVNVNNGFGAGVAAARIARAIGRARAAEANEGV